MKATITINIETEENNIDDILTQIGLLLINNNKLKEYELEYELNNQE